MDKFIPRLPQKEGFKEFTQYHKSKDGNPILALQTGLGKSYLIAMVIVWLMKQHKDYKILIVTHSEKVLVQNFEALEELIKLYKLTFTLGQYSAKLKKKEVGKDVTFATIGSVYNHTDIFPVKYIIIDECHYVGDNKNSMYRKESSLKH